MALCKTNSQIGRAMSYSEQGIKYHVTLILRRLGAKSRAHAVAAAIQHGLLDANMAGNRRLIVEGLTDLRNRSDESLYTELIEQILALKEEVARLTRQIRAGGESAEGDPAEAAIRSRVDNDPLTAGLD